MSRERLSNTNRATRIVLGSAVTLASFAGAYELGAHADFKEPLPLLGVVAVSALSAVGVYEIVVGAKGIKRGGRPSYYGSGGLVDMVGQQDPAPNDLGRFTIHGETFHPEPPGPAQLEE